MLNMLIRWRIVKLGSRMYFRSEEEYNETMKEIEKLEGLLKERSK